VLTSSSGFQGSQLSPSNLLLFRQVWFNFASFELFLPFFALIFPIDFLPHFYTRGVV
jgi:hypothetical protein